MAKLTDFEELVVKINKPHLKDYMREAMTCYFASAYRGCIVLTYIALFDDLLEKVEAIKDINNDAKLIFDEVMKSKNSQQPFENFLVEQLKSKNFISELERDLIQFIKSQRNKTAHPSGHHPSAEEARFLFFEVVDKFLSKKTLHGKHLVDKILSRIKSSSRLFVSNLASDNEIVVKDEMKNIHPDAYRYLVNQIFKLTKSDGEQESWNASFFLYGLAAMNDDNLNKAIIKSVLEECLDKPSFNKTTLEVISSNPRLIELLEGSFRTRYEVLINEELEAMAFGDNSTKLRSVSIITKRLVETYDLNYVIEHYYVYIKTIVTNLCFRNSIIDLVSDSVTLKAVLVESVLSHAGSNTFDIANEFIQRFHDMEAKYVGILSPIQCLELLCSIISASRNGAWRSEGVVENKFIAFNRLKKKAMLALENDAENSSEMLKLLLDSTVSIEVFKSRYLDSAEVVEV